MEDSRKRKKRRSFMQTVKKKFKNNFNRNVGTHLDSDIHEYFLRVFQQSKQEFEDKEERSVFIDNVFSQTEGHEVEYCTNQLVSRVIESFLPECNDAVLKRYLLAFGEDLRPICSHLFASHVLETLLRITSKKVFESVGKHETNNPEDGDSLETYKKFIIKVSKFLLNNLDEYIMDTYANHIARTAICCLSGQFEKSKTDGKNNSKQFNESVLLLSTKEICPDEFKPLLLQFAEFVLNSPMFTEYSNNALMSGLVQSMLLSLHAVRKKKYLKKLIIKLLDVIFSPDIKKYDIMDIKVNQEAVHLLNTMLITSTDEVYEQIRSRCFAGKLKTMAINKTGNYCVQKLIVTCPNSELFEKTYDELSDSFGKIVESGCTGVLFSLSKMCHKLQTKEKQFIKDLEGLLKCNRNDEKEKSEFILKLLVLDRYPFDNCDFTELSKHKINLHGCLIVQELLKFKKSDKVVKSIIALNLSQLIHILCDQKGSHIADVIFIDEIEKKKCQNRFIEKLQGSYVTLATNKYGSFVLTTLWKIASVEHKLCIVKELLNKESLLMNSQSGRIVANTVRLDTYRHQPKEWEIAQKQLLNSKQLFSDIIK